MAQGCQSGIHRNIDIEYFKITKMQKNIVQTPKHTLVVNTRTTVFCWRYCIESVASQNKLPTITHPLIGQRRTYQGWEYPNCSSILKRKRE